MDDVSPNDYTTIAYATIIKQVEIKLTWLAGETIEDLIIRSKIIDQIPEIDLQINQVGIFGSLCELDDEPEVGDRVEIYRSLKIDPKELRRAKAKDL